MADTELTPSLRARFPDDFLWGGSIASHQVEGGTYNQWTRWELEHAAEQAKRAPQRYGQLPNWSAIKDQATDPANYVSGKGIQHYRLYPEDFKMAAQLGMNCLRVGIEWSRIEPTEGSFDLKEIDHYRQYLAELRRQGLTPVLTLWHWTHPIWFEEKGAFTKRANLFYWQRFVEKLCDELKIAELPYICPINEPNVFMFYGYVVGERPPQKRNLWQALNVYHNLVLAHRRAWRVIKSFHPKAQIGSTVLAVNVCPKRPDHWLDKLMARAVGYVSFGWVLRRLRRTQDFVGINYYNTIYCQGLRVLPEKEPLNDLGWHMSPGGLGRLLRQLSRRYQQPFFILENGVADAADKYRLAWLGRTMTTLADCLQSGVKLLGYCHWSLLDNFEWDSGWWPKFGLIAVDHQTSKRTVRRSALQWSKWLKQQKKSHEQ